MLVKLSHEYREIAAQNNAAAHRFTSELPSGDPERERFKSIALALVAARRAGNAKIQEINGTGLTPQGIRQIMRPYVDQLVDACPGLETNTYYALTMTHIAEAVRLVKGD